MVWIDCYDQVRRNSCYDDAGRNSCCDKAGLNSSYNKASRSSYYDEAGRIGILLRILHPCITLTAGFMLDIIILKQLLYVVP